MNKRNACIAASAWLLSLVMTLGLPGVSAAEDDGLLFADDFSTGNLSRHNDHFRWGRSGDIPAADSTSSRIERVEGPDGEPVHAMRFQYRGEDHPDGPSNWSEQRFHLTESVDEQRTERGQSDVAHQEIWISYWLKVPENYHHTARQHGNQKGWLYLWKDGYEQWVSSHEDDDTVTPTTASLHWWPAGTDGESRVSAIHSRERTDWGEKRPSFIAEDRQLDSNSDQASAFLDQEHGQWVHYIFGARAASDADAADGFMRVYINGELAIAWEDLSGGSDRPERNGYDRGYLLGWHNAAYPTTTTYYLADFRVATSRESLGAALPELE